jgi:hypothetical protein
MNNQIKVVFLKEIRETFKDRKFILSTIVNVMIFAVLGFVIDYSLDVSSKFVAGIIIILYPSFSMWILSFLFIQEKFWNVKLINGFQSLLTLPITLWSIWLGKIAAIFVLSYPSTALIAIILALAYFLTVGLNPFITIPLTIWIFSLIIGPILIILYNSIASWIILKFSNPRLIDILQYISIVIFILIFIGYNTLSNLFIILHLTDWTLIIGGIFIIGIITGIIYRLITNLKKENFIT